MVSLLQNTALRKQNSLVSFMMSSESIKSNHKRQILTQVEQLFYVMVCCLCIRSDKHTVCWVTAKCQVSTGQPSCTILLSSFLRADHHLNSMAKVSCSSVPSTWCLSHPHRVHPFCCLCHKRM